MLSIPSSMKGAFIDKRAIFRNKAAILRCRRIITVRFYKWSHEMMTPLSQVFFIWTRILQTLILCARFTSRVSILTFTHSFAQLFEIEHHSIRCFFRWHHTIASFILIQILIIKANLLNFFVFLKLLLFSFSKMAHFVPVFRFLNWNDFQRCKTAYAKIF